MNSIVIRNNEIIINKIKVKLNYRIDEVIDLKDIIVVLLNYPTNKRFNNNVYGISSTGQILWQIENPITDEDNPFVGLSKVGKKIFIIDWTGHRYQIDLITGKILNRKFVK